MAEGELDSIRQRLEEIAEELADLGMRELRSALRSGGTAEAERRLARARRAVLKAAALLSGVA